MEVGCHSWKKLDGKGCDIEGTLRKLTYETGGVVVSDSLGITVSLKGRVSLHNGIFKGTSSTRL